MNKIISRIWSVISILASVLVILICIGGTIGIWTVEEVASSAVFQTLNFMDRTAQGMRDGIAGIDMDIAVLEDTVSSVEVAAEQISQDVANKGLLLTLLPETKEQELMASAQSVEEMFTPIWNFLNATKDLVQVIDSLPFVHLPDLASVETLQGRMDNTRAQVHALITDIREFRSQAAATVSKVTEVTASLNDLLGRFRSDLAEADGELGILQSQARQLQKLLRTILLASSIIVTFLALWIGYSQIVMINKAVRHFRSVKELEGVSKASHSEESVMADERLSTDGEIRQGDSTQTEMDQDLSQNGERSDPDQF